jgi:energy-coupling factor transport system ATP-binding protein
VIEVNKVFYAYSSGTVALKEVSLKIQRGEFVAIMGENGAGKTTLIKHLNGLFKPTKGSVTVDNVDTRERSVAELSRKVGLVFQNPDHQLFSETVEEEIAFGLVNFGYDPETIKRRTVWALNLLDLKRYRDSSPFMLSGGERKRVALASVLAWNPEYIVLDEPTIGQDQMQKDRLRELIIQLNTQGRTVIIVSHDIEFVADCAPRVVLMSQGGIIADGPASTILTDYGKVLAASLVRPQITQLFQSLSDLGLPGNVIDLYEAERLLVELIKGGKI